METSSPSDCTKNIDFSNKFTFLIHNINNYFLVKKISPGKTDGLIPPYTETIIILRTSIVQGPTYTVRDHKVSHFFRKKKRWKSVTLL